MNLDQGLWVFDVQVEHQIDPVWVFI